MTFRVFFFVAVMAAILVASPARGAGPVQIYVEPEGKPQINAPLNVNIFALDENGNIVKDFSTLRKLTVSLDEEKGKQRLSARAWPTVVEFREGAAHFSISDTEAETLHATVEVEDIKSPSELSIVFRGNDDTPPKIKDVRIEKMNLIALEFSEPLDKETASDEKNYKAVTNKREAHPSSVEVHNDNVILKFPSAFMNDEEGHIEVEGIKDVNGNAVESGTRSDDFKGGDCHCQH